MDKELRFEVKLTAKELWRFSMYHSNGGMMGIVNILFTVAALFLIITRWSVVGAGYRLLLVVCILMFTVFQPALLYSKARKQAKTPAVAQPMTLVFHDAGLRVEQNGQQVEFTWDQMGRLDKTPSLIVLYMDRVHAYLLPIMALGDQETEFYEMVKAHLPKERLRHIK